MYIIPKNPGLLAVRPLIEVPNQLVGAPMGTDVTLSCKVEASPKPINYWTRQNGEYLRPPTNALATLPLYLIHARALAYYTHALSNVGHLSACVATPISSFML